jgi:cell division protein FtsZ
VTLIEISEAMDLIHDAADPEANIIFGAVIDEGLCGAMKITVIATNLAAASGKSEPGDSSFLVPQTGNSKSNSNNRDAPPDFNTPAFLRKSAN